MNGTLIKNTFKTKEELRTAIEEAKNKLENLNPEDPSDEVRAEYWGNRLESLNDFMIEFVTF